MTDRQIGWLGLAAAASFATGSAIWAFDQPGAGATATEITTFYEDASTRIVIGGSLSLLSIAMIVVFASGMRSILARQDRDDVLATAAFGGALVAMAAGLGAETINMAAALRAGDGELSGELARSLFEISYVLGYNAAGVGLAVFAICIAAVSLRSRSLLGRSGALVTLAVGVLLLTPLVEVALALAVLLLFFLALKLLRAEPNRSRESPSP